MASRFYASNEFPAWAELGLVGLDAAQRKDSLRELISQLRGGIDIQSDPFSRVSKPYDDRSVSIIVRDCVCQFSVVITTNASVGKLSRIGPCRLFDKTNA